MKTKPTKTIDGNVAATPTAAELAAIKQLSPVVTWDCRMITISSGSNWLKLTNGERVILRLQGRSELTRLWKFLARGLHMDDDHRLNACDSSATVGRFSQKIWLNRAGPQMAGLSLTINDVVEFFQVSTSPLDELLHWLNHLNGANYWRRIFNDGYGVAASRAADGFVYLEMNSGEKGDRLSLNPDECRCMQKTLLQAAAQFQQQEVILGGDKRLTIVPTVHGSTVVALQTNSGPLLPAVRLGQHQLVRLAAQIEVALLP